MPASRASPQSCSAVMCCGSMPSNLGDESPVRSGSGTIASSIKRLTEWVARRHPELMPERPTFPYSADRHAVTSDARQLSPSQLKTILRACYEEIDAAWATFEEGRRLLARGEDDEAHPHGALLRQVREAGGGVVVTRAHMKQHYQLGQTIGRHGGPEMLARYLHLTPDTLTPFFIAIAIQTAANVDALRLIDRDCIEPHPLIEHRAMVDWQKGRAGRTFQRAQRRSFDRRHPYAAPRLIEMVLAMTAPLAALAPPGESDRLFLMRRRSGVSVIQRTALDAAMARFVARANARVNAWNAQHPTAPRENLPPFCPTMFRSSVAGEHYRASGGDIRVAQDVLNHRSAATGGLYPRRAEPAAAARDHRSTADDNDRMDPGSAFVAGRRGCTGRAVDAGRSFRPSLPVIR